MIGNQSHIIDILFNERRVLLNRTDNDGRTAMHWAVYSHRDRIVRKLLKMGIYLLFPIEKSSSWLNVCRLQLENQG